MTLRVKEDYAHMAQTALMTLLCVTGSCGDAVPVITVDGRQQEDLQCEFICIPDVDSRGLFTRLLAVDDMWIARLPDSAPKVAYDFTKRGPFWACRDEDCDSSPVVAFAGASPDGTDASKASFDIQMRSLSGRELASLWGLVITAWSTELAGTLQTADLTNVGVSLVMPIRERDVPGLAAVLSRARFVTLCPQRCPDGTQVPGLQTLIAALAHANNLCYLAVNLEMWDSEFDAGLLRGCTRLRYLALIRGRLRHAESLTGLVNLDGLDLRHSKGIGDGSFLRAMRHLRMLNVTATNVTNLRVLEDHALLASIRANNAAVNALPQVCMPKLTSLELLHSALKEKDVTAFSVLNPQTVVLFRKREALVRAVGGTTSLRFSRSRQEDIVHVTSQEEIAQFLDNTIIEEDTGPYLRDCLSEDFSVAFCRGDLVLVRLHWHHGFLLRSRVWGLADALLTEGSATYLSSWLNARGMPGPLRELRAYHRQVKASNTLKGMYVRIVPEHVLSLIKFQPLWRSAGNVRLHPDADRIPDILARSFPNPVLRASVCFRLLGCRVDGAWREYAGLERAVVECLDDVGKEPLGRSTRDVMKDTIGKNGVARYIFGEGQWESIEHGTFLDVIPALSAWGLSHPEKMNRAVTIYWLGVIGGEAAIAALRSVLRNEVEIRPITDEETRGVADIVSAHPCDVNIPRYCSDQAHAALVLANMGMTDILETVRSLHAKATGADVAALTQALVRLQNR